MMTHTKGPWYIERQEDLCPHGNGYVWAIHGRRASEEKNSNGGWKHYIQNPAYANSQANARLIASAPTLLNALKKLLESIENVDFSFLDDNGQTYDQIPWAQAEAAIAQATDQNAGDTLIHTRRK
jgi:hypothetical protein